MNSLLMTAFVFVPTFAHTHFLKFFLMKKNLFSCLLLAAAFCAHAQVNNPAHICGNGSKEQIDHLLPRVEANLAAIENGQHVSDRAIVYVPIHYHLVAGTDGNGRAKEVTVLDNLCRLNQAYADQDIRFYLSTHGTPAYGLFNKTINSDNVYLNQTSTFVMNSRRHKNAINVFVVKEPASGGGNPPGVIVNGYYSPSNDWIVLRSTEVNGKANNPTAPHEVGHFFSLPHTFLGWEEDPFESSDPTWPVAPVLSPAGTPTERVNGTNCTQAADRICDTPPDYNFGLPDTDNNCKYEGSGGQFAKDPLGVVVDPMEENMMGYFNGCNPFVFTAQQKAIIAADINASDRNYLDNTFVPAATSIETPTDLLIAPANNGQAVFNNVILEWKPVTGATYYLVEVDITSLFGSVQLQTFVVSGTTQTITNLLNNKKYYWRVRPFNEYVTCAAARTGIFNTATTSTENIEGLTAMQVSPNPVAEGESARLTVSTETGFEASVRVFNAEGRPVYTQEGLVFPQGNTTVELPLTGLPNGMYFVALQNGQGQTMRKLTVVR